jgi:hypothetical protein
MIRVAMEENLRIRAADEKDFVSGAACLEGMGWN